MSGVRQNVCVKIAAGVAAVVFLMATILLAVGSLFAVAGMYNATREYVERNVLEYLTYEECENIYNAYICGDDPVELYSKTNLCFRILDNRENVLLETEDADDYEIYSAMSFGFWWENDTWAEEDSISVEVGYRNEFMYQDRFAVVCALVNWLYTWRYLLPVLTVACAILFLACIVWLIWASGYVRGREEAKNSWFEMIPLDLLLVVCMVSLLLCLELLIDRSVWVLCIGGCGCLLAGSVMLVLLLRTIAVRLKTHSLWRTTLIGLALRMCFRILRRLGHFLWRIFANLPMYGKSILLILVNFFLDMVVGILSYPDTEIFLLFLLVKDAGLGIALLYTTMILRRIQAGGKRLADGQLGAKLDTAGMYGDFKSFAEDMNRIGDGMENAVQERMKSERFRAELITNVSHDIKTPLTSITSYVDLMKKENITEEPLCGYIEVLDRQSARLKKLTEDLIEASKAATGNLPVHLESVDASVLLMQALGEYTAKMKDAELDPVVNAGDQPLMILADGRLLWRVLDNVMNNIVKYAMPSTRVYIDMMKNGNYAHFRFRNISRDPLPGAGEELLERFTRGDSSRSTEGSGLGLSIANSLTELQGGKLTLVVDGDLFKLILSMPLAEALDDGTASS